MIHKMPNGTLKSRNPYSLHEKTAKNPEFIK